MDALSMIMMFTALSWPMLGGAVVGLIGGIVKGHGLVGTLIDIVLGGVTGYALTIAFMLLAERVTFPDQATLPLSLGLPALGGLLALLIKGRFTSA